MLTPSGKTKERKKEGMTEVPLRWQKKEKRNKQENEVTALGIERIKDSLAISYRPNTQGHTIWSLGGGWSWEGRRPGWAEHRSTGLQEEERANGWTRHSVTFDSKL